MYIDFRDIQTGEDFELFCEDLLQTMGFSIESKVARGPDQGRDILAVQTLVDKAGISEIHRYLVECKHHAVSEKSVLEKEIGSPIARMGVHKCNRYILITSTVPSVKVQNQLKGISNTVPSYRAIVWSKGDLKRFLHDYPAVRNRYFQPVFECENSGSTLPGKVIQTFKGYLESPGHFNNLRKLLLQYPEFLPIEKGTNPAYEFRTNIQVPEGGIVDCIAARPDSVGVKGYMYYFGSPYDSPFTESGEPQRELNHLLELAHKHASIAIHSLPWEHPLHPSIVTGLESAGMKLRYFTNRELQGFGSYSLLNIYLVVGQRAYQCPIYDVNQRISTMRWKERFVQSNQTVIKGCDIRCEIVSYSRLVQFKLI